ncbi:cell division protein FtsX [Clostridium cavendishii DSM 21758]|uniref:Cell division protein FtsX n=1 Tax=Clostridium cavendishii DSM 21758 TaxID=1121302 RepID=A0A1M6CML9_9CLOT|nr:FtsX-like permease family protein [Clostridium cavendishii]SHI62199.1 cell division protein FtsX [Clostridium cavendishii DSM 21758]
MKISTYYLLLKDASKNIRKHATISISSIIAVMLTLLILEMFLLSFLNLKVGIIGANTQFEIRVSLKDDIKVTDKQNIYNKIKSANGVTDINFKNNKSLSAAYIIKVNGPDDIPKIISRLNGSKGIDKINGGPKVQEKIVIKAKIIQLIGFILFLILMVAAFFLIKNTIKLSIYPRINDIRTMQYLGATDWFIRWTFIFEGMIIGFLGAVFSLIAIYFLYSLVYKKATSFLAKMFITFIDPSFILTTMSWSFILIGIILTTIGNVLVLKKFLILKKSGLSI